MDIPRTKRLLIPILIPILILVLIIYYICLYQTHVTFLSKNETHDLLLTDKDEFIATLSEINLIARKAPTQTAYLLKIKDSADNFTISEKQRLTLFCKFVDNWLVSQDIFIDGFDPIKASQLDWKFAKTSGDLYEDGLPHTRLEYIMLSESFLTNDNEYLIQILLHEKVHIYQRKYPNDLQTYLQSKNIEILAQRDTVYSIIANPDLDAYVYSIDSVPMLRRYNSSNPESIEDSFITPYNQTEYEHPREMQAYEIDSLIAKAMK